MFLVKDNYKERKNRIKGFLKTEPPIAIILSAVHFEWTVRRAIIALGKSPNMDIRKELRHCHGLKKYRKLWKKEVACKKTNPALISVVNNWQDFRDAFEERHRLVHGASSCSEKFATPKVDLILSGANDVREFCNDNGIDIYERIPVRRIKR
ncbi:MAG: hypothetical protein H8E98_08480 [Bacteroidetes bacterium]|nr:hypothetical protein [Bacteroidota bacterium]MBL7110303.1 hypothetical protein [Candidatus Neomarinimicrobiota bacterium]